MFYGKRKPADAGVSARSGAAGTDNRSDAAGVAEDLGIWHSTLTRWQSQERDASEPSEAAVNVHAELKRLPSKSHSRP